MEVKLTVRITKELREELKKEAKANDKTLNQVALERLSVGLELPSNGLENTVARLALRLEDLLAAMEKQVKLEPLSKAQFKAKYLEQLKAMDANGSVKNSLTMVLKEANSGGFKTDDGILWKSKLVPEDV